MRELVHAKIIHASLCLHQNLLKFNALRNDMESQFPPHEITPEQKKAILQRMIMHQMMGEVKRDMASPAKKKNKTKTFG